MLIRLRLLMCCRVLNMLSTAVAVGTVMGLNVEQEVGGDVNVGANVVDRIEAADVMDGGGEESTAVAAGTVMGLKQG